ncbi:MAG: redox-regulated ATPase YchF, partial [Acholeplasmatales bacterium]|nr:redox-regulated ATPase YchF [Acholeplasmatales bacterium]
MGLKAGIIGLPNVGKTTLFNALTKGDALAANYPFATIEPNKGVVNVFDSRLDFLTELYHPKKTTPTSFEFIDIAGLVKGASTGEGLGNQFLSHIRNVDAICHVVRAFSDVNVTHVDGSVDPIRDISTINYELSLSDEDIVIKRIQKIEKKALTGDKEAAFELNCLKKIKECIDNLEDPKKLSFDKEEALLIKNYNLLTLKPVIYIFNILDSELSNLSSNKFYNQIVTY